MDRESLRRIRKKNRYSQKAMAEILGVSYSLYQKMEYGLRKINMATVQRLKNIFIDEAEK